MPQNLHALADWLVDANLVSQADIDQMQGRGPVSGLLLASALIEKQKVDELQVVTVLSSRLGVPAAPHRLYKQSISHKVLSSIPEDLCWQHHVFPFGVDRADGRLLVAMTDPTDQEALQVLQSLAGTKPKVFLIGPTQLDKAIRKHYMDSWVDETGGKRRFFGYSDITNPGVQPKTRPAAPKPHENSQRATLPRLDQSAPAISPEPEPALMGNEISQGADDKRSTGPLPPAELETIPIAPLTLDAPENALPSRVTEPSAAPIARISIGDDRTALRQRLLMLEDALADLLDALTQTEDPRLAAVAAVIRKRIRDTTGV